MSKIYVTTQSGYNFSVDVAGLEKAMATENAKLSDCVHRLTKMLDALTGSEPKLLEPTHPDRTGLQDLALQVGKEAKIPGLNALSESALPRLKCAVLERLLSSSKAEIEDWIGGLEDATPVLAETDTVMFGLTGQKQKPEQKLTVSLKQLRKETLLRAEADKIDLARKAVYWQQIVKHLQSL